MICEDRSPAFIMAKLGCDVYMANTRGNAYSLGHDTLNIDSSEFWDFSFQEMGLDSLANLSFILEKTGKKVQFFGHSQGATQMVAALSDINTKLANDISSKISVFHALAPVVLMVIKFKIQYFFNLFEETNKNAIIKNQFHW